MSRVFAVHRDNPQMRLIKQAAEILNADGVIVYPTDSFYALGCRMRAAKAEARIRRLRGVSESHLFALCCRDLEQVGQFAQVDNTAFRVLKNRAPGPFTFVMPASKKVRRQLCCPKRRTVAVRLHSHPVARALLDLLDEPMLTTTLHLANEDSPLENPADFPSRLGREVDLILDSGACPSRPSTVVDFSEDPPKLLREGGGDLG